VTCIGFDYSIAAAEYSIQQVAGLCTGAENGGKGTGSRQPLGA